MYKYFCIYYTVYCTYVYLQREFLWGNNSNHSSALSHWKETWWEISQKPQRAPTHVCTQTPHTGLLGVKLSTPTLTRLFTFCSLCCCVCLSVFQPQFWLQHSEDYFCSLCSEHSSLTDIIPPLMWVGYGVGPFLKIFTSLSAGSWPTRSNSVKLLLLPVVWKMMGQQLTVVPALVSHWLLILLQLSDHGAACLYIHVVLVFINVAGTI